ncbi:MAG: T9SS type A sorting domain-containing protein [Flavobacteriales bacterium]|nr:T9SS type A sorting domain-containing protein [Flavobacteriales bacterium]
MALLLPLGLLSQSPYDLTVLSQPYAPLQGATALSPAEFDEEGGWDDPEFTAPIGFEFEMVGNTISEMTQYGLGSVLLGLTLDPKAGALLHGVMPTNYDLADRAISGGTPSTIQWATTGEPGNQVFTIEWAEAGMYDEVFGPDSVAPSYVNIQVRLFEADNSIEFHYGPSDISDAITSFEPQVSGLFLNLDFDTYVSTIVALEGSAEAPTLEVIANIEDWYYGPALLSYPTDGTVYRFGPNGTSLSVDDTPSAGLSFYPNPAVHALNVRFTGMRPWRVLDLAGRVLMTGTNQGGVQLDMAPLASGTYILSVEGAPAQRFIRQ